MKLLLVLLVAVAAVQAAMDAVVQAPVTQAPVVQAPDNLITPEFVGVQPPAVINSLIIGGSPAAQNQFPYMAAIVMNGAWFCGGTLLTKRYVLTAAHCAQTSNFFALHFASINWLDTAVRITKTTTTKIVHSNYNPTTYANDVALLVMANDLASSYFTSSPPRLALVRLPKVSDATNGVTYAGKLAAAMGWGKTSNSGGISKFLYYVTGMTILSNAVCKNYYGTIVQSYTLCSYGGGTKNVCNGDSGGPLMVTEMDGKYTQVGVTSFGSSVTCYTYPSGYSRVTNFLPWLKNNVPTLVIRP